MDQLTITLLRRADDAAADHLAEIYGPDWRDHRIRTMDAAKVLMCHIKNIYSLMLVKRHMHRKRGPWRITFGMVFDHQKRRNAFKQPRDFDNLALWSRQYKWPLYSNRRDLVRFMRSAHAARAAGMPLEEAEVITANLLAWGVSDSLVIDRWVRDEWWAGKPRAEWTTSRKTGGRFKIWVWKVSDLLDWFMYKSAPEMENSTDIVRDAFRLVKRGCQRYQETRCPDHPLGRVTEKYRCAVCGRKLISQWVAATMLQRAWNYYYLLARTTTGRPSGSVLITPRRLNNYMAQSLEALAGADPDWSRRPIPPNVIDPNLHYPVLLPYQPEWDEHVVHSPIGVRLIEVLAEGASGWVAHHAAKASGLPSDRVFVCTGAHILRYPHAYTMA